MSNTRDKRSTTCKRYLIHPYLNTSILFVLPSDKNKTREEKRRALHLKYQEAVELYATTDLPLYMIAERCQVSYGGLSSYLRRYQRELVLKRHRIPVKEGEDPKDIKIIAAGKQSVKAHAKYKDAIAACDSLDHIDLNLSEVARIYNLDGTALANLLGINDNLHRGVRPESEKQYAEAVELYRTTIMSIPEIAEACHISESGFNQHLRFYHKKLLKEKESQRRRVAEEPKKIRGELLGNGRNTNRNRRRSRNTRRHWNFTEPLPLRKKKL